MQGLKIVDYSAFQRLLMQVVEECLSIMWKFWQPFTPYWVSLPVELWLHIVTSVIFMERRGFRKKGHKILSCNMRCY